MSLIYIYCSARAGFHCAATSLATSATPIRRITLFSRSRSSLIKHNSRTHTTMSLATRKTHGKSEDPVKSATKRVATVSLNDKDPEDKSSVSSHHASSGPGHHAKRSPEDAKSSKSSDRKAQPEFSAENGWDGKAEIPASKEGISILRKALEDKSLWKLKESAMLRTVRSALANEAALLKGIKPAEKGLPGRTEQHRTELGVKALYWITNGDYDSFVRGQNSKVQLKPSSFRDIRGLFKKILEGETEAYLALIMSIFVNDLGKAIKSDKSGQNHDVLLANAAEKGVIKSINCLDPTTAKEVRLGIKLGGELNIAQLQQAENVVRCLDVLKTPGSKSAFQHRFLEQVLDIAGAQGHASDDDVGCTPIIEPFWQGLTVAYEQCILLTARKATPLGAYDAILSNRASVLMANEYRKCLVEKPKDRSLMHQYQTDRALLRLFLMGRVSSRAAAEEWEAEFKGLDPKIKLELIHRLNVNGSKDEHAIIPYYMPAVFSEGLKSMPDNHNHPSGRLKIMMKYLNMVLETPHAEEGRGQVYEKDLTPAKDYVKTLDFRREPESLLKKEIPEGVQVI